MARPECDTPLVLNWHHFCRKMEVIQAMATWKSKSTWRSVGISLEILSNSLMRAESCSWAEHFCWVSERERERERVWVSWLICCRRGLSNIAGCTAFQWDGPSCTWQHTRDHEGGGGFCMWAWYTFVELLMIPGSHLLVVGGEGWNGSLKSKVENLTSHCSSIQ
jgi:hypothetical protein